MHSRLQHLTLAICCHNRASRLPALAQALLTQECPIPFQVLFVNNNSRDNTESVLRELCTKHPKLFRYVNEQKQGIVHARNRAIEESLDSDILAFIDDDELPRPGLLATAVQCLENGADCVGGRVHVNFEGQPRPKWLTDDLLGFLAEVDYGDSVFAIHNTETPLWTANIAYRTKLFEDGLRFDRRYNRAGHAVGGGEDLVMFETLLRRKTPMQYCPHMVVDHFVEPWRLHRRYFLRLHYHSGIKSGMWDMPRYDNEIFGIPPFLFRQALMQCLRLFSKCLKRGTGVMRQAMNVTHAIGMIIGTHRRKRASESG